MEFKVLGEGLRVVCKAGKPIGIIGIITGWAVDVQGGIKYTVFFPNDSGGVEESQAGSALAMDKDEFDVSPDQSEPFEELVKVPDIFGSTVNVQIKGGSISCTVHMIAHRMMEEELRVVVQTEEGQPARVSIRRCIGEVIDRLRPEERMLQFPQRE